MYFWWSMVTFQPRAEVWVLSQAGPKAFCFCRWQQNRHVISKLLTHKQGWIRGPKLLQPRICIEYPFLSLQSLPLLWEKLKIFSLMVTPGNEVVSVLQLFSEVWDLVMCDFVTCDGLLTPHGCCVCYQPSSRTSWEEQRRKIVIVFMKFSKLGVWSVRNRQLFPVPFRWLSCGLFGVWNTIFICTA